MSNQKLWYGYLEAGSKSTPVIRDPSIDPGIADTLFLYNMKSGQIVRYKASIVESKLRDLKPAEEKEFISELDSGFKKARKEFKIATAATLYSTTSKVPAKKTESKVDKSDDDLDSFDSEDIDLDIDTEMIDADSEIADDDDDTEIVDDD